jgi:peptidoglycan/LPS O-acetylase OafA/YrhL
MASNPASSRRRRGLGYLPALDGLRALSVLAVVLYHGSVSPFSAGFVGVDVFFVISGYLITSLLLAEWRATGRVSLSAFYLRRARRLLPALFTVLAAVSAYALVFLDHDQASALPGDVLASLLYIQNWHLVAGGDYFAGESLLKHLWSLAIEEQFYLVWPAVFAVALRRSRGRTASLVRGVVAASALSIAWMALQFDDFDPNALNDAYVGTHTRAFTILAGVLLAFAWSPGRGRNRGGHGAGLVVDAVGLAAIGALTWIATRLTFEDPFFYPRGFVVVAVLAALAVAAAVHPRSRIVRGALSAPTLVAIGKRSYAIYLWNWPIVALTTPREDIPLRGIPLTVLRLVLTFALAAASYRCIEHPIRAGALAAYIHRMRSGGARARRRLVANVLFGTAAIATTAFVLGSGLARLQPDDVEAAPDAAPTTTVAPASTSTGAPAPAEPRQFATPVRAVVVGDSVAATLTEDLPVELADSLVIHDGSSEGCGVMRGRIRSSAGLRRDLGRDCAGWQQQWKTAARKADAQVALVVIGAWDVFDVEVDGQRLEFATRAWDNEFAQQLRSGIAALEKAGAQVALAELPCWRPVDGGGLAALPERGDDERTRHVNSLLRRAAQRDPLRVFAVEPPAEYCTDERVGEDLGERWDGVHYDDLGARRFYDAVTPQLLQIPPPPPATAPNAPTSTTTTVTE